MSTTVELQKANEEIARLRTRLATVELQKRCEAAEIIVRESARWGYELAAAGKPFLEPYLEWDAHGNPIVKVRADDE